MRNIKLAALDLDDTTLRSDSTLAPETYEALSAAADAGIEIVVASGRAFKSLPKSILELKNVHYAISSNGAAVENAKTGERIISFLLDAAVVEKIISDFGEDGLYECFIKGQPYSPKTYMDDPLRYGCSPAYINYVRTTRLPVEDMPSFIRQNADRLDSLDIICPTAEKKAEVYEKAKLFEDAYVTSSSPRLVEFASPMAGKGRALRRLCAMLGVDKTHVAAFGNGDNDADMLSFAGFGVAVENATAYCKSCADYICPSNDDFGVAKTLLSFIEEK